MIVHPETKNPALLAGEAGFFNITEPFFILLGRILIHA
jgi:hypothetical protein